MVEKIAAEKVNELVNAIRSPVQLMVVGVIGESGVLVQNPVVAENRGEHEVAPIHHLLLVAETVLENDNRHKPAIRMCVQWTVSGAAGRTGLSVPGHVELDSRNALELVQNQHLLTEARVVRDQQMKHGNVAKEFVQLTVDGVNGRAGRYVQLHVVTELKNVNARAQNRAQNLVGKIVMVSVGKPRHVKQYHAQCMVSGVSGRTGHPVQRLVALEHKKGNVRVPIRPQRLVGRIASAWEGKSNHARKKFVQFTEAGVPGRTGVLVPKHVDLDNKLESENVIAPGQNMEEDRVRGLENKCECATPGNVQLMDSGVNGNLGQYAQELAAEEFRRVPARALNPVPRMGEKIAKVV